MTNKTNTTNTTNITNITKQFNNITKVTNCLETIQAKYRVSILIDKLHILNELQMNDMIMLLECNQLDMADIVYESEFDVKVVKLDSRHVIIKKGWE